MEENMADGDHAPSAGLLRLYAAWAEGGAGLIVTGNVMVDARAMTGPGGVVLEDDRHLDRFRAWAAAGRAGGAQMWMQINHPGRQMPAALGQQTLAPSAVAIDIGSLSKRFPRPREMTAADIAAVATMPLMVTGGIRRREVAEKVVGSGIAMAGIATALAIAPDLPRHWRLGRPDVPTLRPIAWQNKQLASSAHMAAVRYQMVRLGRRRPAAPGVPPAWALLVSQADARCRARRYRRWMEKRAAA